MSQNPAELVKEMAKLTITTGKVNPIQEYNMKMYPFVFLEGVKTISVDFDLRSTPIIDTSSKDGDTVFSIEKPNVEDMYVNYNIAVDEEFFEINKEINRLQGIEKSIHNLFWTGIKVKIVINNEIVYGKEDE
jgi:hypothetical protein